MHQVAEYQIAVGKNLIISENSYDSFHCGTTEKYTIKMVAGGQAAYDLGKRELRLSPGSFLFLNDRTNYCNRIRSNTPVNTYSVLFDPEFVNDFEYVATSGDNRLLSNPNGRNSNLRFVESIYPLTGEMQHNLTEMKNHTDFEQPNQLLLAEYLNSCMLNYYRVYHLEVTTRADALQFLNSTTKSEVLKRLSIAKDYIISNYNRNITLEDIAQAACLSVNHLLRTFKQAYQQSPYQFLTKFRLQQAKYYLKNTDHPVSEIVDMIGFECPSSFIRLFKHAFQITPGRYR